MKKRIYLFSLITLLTAAFFFLPSTQAANTVHTVSSGDTVKSIAAKYKIPADQLMKSNGLPEAKVFPGQKLQINHTAYKSAQYQWYERGRQAANYAGTFAGFKKAMGEESPEKGFDSSGLIYWVLSQQGIPLDRTTIDGFYKLGMETDSPKAGDLIFFVKKDTAGKVIDVLTGGIYLGDKRFVHSGYGSSSVKVKSVSDQWFKDYNYVFKTFTPKGEHVVKKGETLKSVAAKYNKTPAAIKELNGLPSDTILEGRYLQVYNQPLFPFYSEKDAAYGKAIDVIKYAYTFRGYEYVWSEESPEAGFDCSGFIYYAMNKQDLPISRKSAATYSSLADVIAEPKTGDLVFFENTGNRTGVTHVGIYLGNGYFLNTTERAGVHISHMSSSFFTEKFHSYGKIASLFN
ncbi:NlpC/P60 family protein [Bacillus infantis]|uniref:C40 family peptidase n=1 Tax=Bacillus infantis TaxID=324767 RepID=UPI003CEBCB3A